jgi:hypothetical protein
LVEADIYCDDELADDFMSQIILYPSLKSENFSQGLCGKWSKSPNELSFISKLEKESDQEGANYIIQNRFLESSRLKYHYLIYEFNFQVLMEQIHLKNILIQL